MNKYVKYIGSDKYNGGKNRVGQGNQKCEGDEGVGFEISHQGRSLGAKT